MERASEFYIDKGFIDVADNAEFRIIVDALHCFGGKHKGVQTSFFPHPSDNNLRIWFPKFYANEEWSNVFSDDEKTITERCLNPLKVRRHMDEIRAKKSQNRLVFAHMENSSGELTYIFKGEYGIVWNATNYENGFVHRRISTKAKTYSS